MKKQVSIKLENGIAKINLGKSENSVSLEYFKSVECEAEIISSTELNTVGVSADIYSVLQGESVILYNSQNGKFIEIALKQIKIDNDKIKLSNYLKEFLNISDNSKNELHILKNCVCRYSQVNLQKIDNIKEDYIVLSENDMNGKKFEADKYLFFRVYNSFTGESLIVKNSHIKVQPSLRDGTVLLNKKQRTFLGKELPQSISSGYWKEIISKIPSENKEAIELLKNSYTESDHFLKTNLSYDDKEKLKSIINDNCGHSLNIAPVIESYCQKSKRGFKRISDFFVGKSTLSLMCKRPYVSDEGADIIRMTSSNMKLLGIGEMDSVILRYKNNAVKCRVLELDDKNSFLDANVPADLNYSVGIPAHIRKKLGLCNTKSAIKIDRDTSFIFKKSINEQILPVILTLFSINLFYDPTVWIKALISLLSVPIVVYLNLSSKRKMRG